MPANTCLVVETPYMDSPTTAFSRRHPYCVIDLVEEPQPRPTPKGPAHRTVCLVSRMQTDDEQSVIEALSTEFGEVHTVDRDPVRGHWLGEFWIQPHEFVDRRIAVLHGLFDRFGLKQRWVRVEQGTMYARAFVPSTEDANKILTRVREELAIKGLSLQVELATGLEPASEALRALIQATDQKPSADLLQRR
jgi:RNA binding exosome subunit